MFLVVFYEGVHDFANVAVIPEWNRLALGHCFLENSPTIVSVLPGKNHVHRLYHPICMVKYIVSVIFP